MAAGNPIPMLLWCPSCAERHIDVGEFATKPHHTHACQSCGMVWRPAVEHTVGVRYLPGFKNEEAAYHVETGGERRVLRWEAHVSLPVDEAAERALWNAVRGYFVTLDFGLTRSISTRWLRLVHRVVVESPAGAVAVTGLTGAVREMADRLCVLEDLEGTREG